MIDEKRGKVLNYKRATLKDNQDSVLIQLIDNKIFSKAQEGSHYRFNHMIISRFNQEKYLWCTQITTIAVTDIEVSQPTDDDIVEINWCHHLCYILL